MALAKSQILTFQIKLAGLRPVMHPLLWTKNFFSFSPLLFCITTSSLLTYTLYTFDATLQVQDGRMLSTAPLIGYCISRYFGLFHMRQPGDVPDELPLKAKPLLINIALWIVTMLGLLYAV